MNELEEIIQGVYRVAPGRSNCYLLADETLALIDTGMPKQGDAIMNAIQKIGRTVSEVSHIFITHAHLDHIGSLAAIKKASGALVVAGAKDTAYIEGRRKTWTMGREGLGGKFFKTVLFIMESFLFHYEPTQVDIPCHGGEVIDCCGGIQVVASPGHSPGSLSFYHRGKGLLFVGDALNGTGGFALPRRFGCVSHRDALRSVEALTRLEFDTCLPGHGEPVRGNARDRMKELLFNKPA